MIPKVLLSFYSRPMSAGIMFRDGFRQAGCKVMVAGPCDDEVYGIRGWPDDYMPTDIPLGVEPINVNIVVNEARARGFDPDVVVCIDQFDFNYLVGQSDSVPFVYVAIEDFNPLQRERYEQRTGAVEYHMIGHGFPHLVPPESEWLAFGFDFSQHACGPVGVRDKIVCQIGSPYEPRPSNWNFLRAAFDGAHAPPAPLEMYRLRAVESPSTVFGRADSYALMREVYQRSWFALSASNCEFLPMRVPEALGFGCVLVSDDVKPVRAVMGDPWPANPDGCWVVHDRTSEGMLHAIKSVLDCDGAKEAMQQRAIVRGYSGQSYFHRAQQILKRVGLSGAGRLV